MSSSYEEFVKKKLLNGESIVFTEEDERSGRNHVQAEWIVEAIRKGNGVNITNATIKGKLNLMEACNEVIKLYNQSDNQITKQVINEIKEKEFYNDNIHDFVKIEKIFRLSIPFCVTDTKFEDGLSAGLNKDERGCILFEKEVNLSDSKINNANFSYAWFENNVNFEDTTFYGTETSFKYSTFNGQENSSFCGAIFESDNTTFEKSVFYSKKIYFSGGRFKSKVLDFNSVTFKGGIVSFGNRNFYCDTINFNGTKFLSEKETNFQFTEFDSVKYYDAEIDSRDNKTQELKGEIFFENTEFRSKKTDFLNTSFKSQSIYFKDAKFFSEETIFKRQHNKPTFKCDYFSFEKSKFYGAKTDFSRANFESKKISF